MMMMMCVEMDWILMTVSEPKFESEIECNAVINVTKLTLGTKTALDFNGASYFVVSCCRPSPTVKVTVQNL